MRNDLMSSEILGVGPKIGSNRREPVPSPNEITFWQNGSCFSRNTTVESIIDANAYGANVATVLRSLKDGERVTLREVTIGNLEVKCGSGVREIKRFRLRY